MDPKSASKDGYIPEVLTFSVQSVANFEDYFVAQEMSRQVIKGDGGCK